MPVSSRPPPAAQRVSFCCGDSYVNVSGLHVNVPALHKVSEGCAAAA